MSVETARAFLLWCTIIDYAALMVWFLAFAVAHDWLHRMQGRWYRLSREQFDAANWVAMAHLKIGILMFNLVPCVVLYIVA